jgi:hypothetical protein
LRVRQSILLTPGGAGSRGGAEITGWTRSSYAHKQRKLFSPDVSRQPVEKAYSAEENQRKSKLFPWKNLAGAWARLAQFG